MNSENKLTSNDGLPEIYTSPSQSSRQFQENYLNESKVWDGPILSKESISKNNSIINDIKKLEENVSSKYVLSRLKSMTNSECGLASDLALLNIFGENNSNPPDKRLNRASTQIPIQKEKKHGETPGSDSPSNFLVALTNLKLNYNFKDDLKRNDVSEFDSNSIPFSNMPSCQLEKCELLEVIEGADGKVVLPLSSSLNQIENIDFHIPPSISSSEIELNLLCRKSPAGISTPEIFSNNASTDNEYVNSIFLENNSSLRPPVLGHCEAGGIPSLVSHRKDLGSTDGEDSSNGSINKSVARKDNKKIILIEPCSVGSQSENTDSNSTVLDMKRLPVQGCENECKIFTGMNHLLEPNFLVGGPISPCSTVVDETSIIPGEAKYGTYAGLAKVKSRNSNTDQEDSLISLVSAESTHHPESSECITPPSVACMSISSIASSKKLEWDSAADVGYNRKSFELKDPSFPRDSLSTLERIAIGSYAAIMRTEPEGTTNAKCKMKIGNKNKTFFKQKYKNVVRQHKDFDRENKFLIGNSSKMKSDYSSSGDNEASFESKKVIGVRNPLHKISKHDKDSFQVSNLKKKSNSSSGIYSSKSELKNHICKDDKYTFDTLQSDNDGHALRNKFLDLKFFQSGKSASAVSLPYYCISSACGAPTFCSQKTHSHQMFNFNDNIIKKNLNKEGNLHIMERGPSSDNSNNEKQSNVGTCQTAALSGNSIYSLAKSDDHESLNKSEVSYTGNYSYSSSISTSSSLSLSSINNVLSSFSSKLKEYVLSLMNNGSFSDLNDYEKLQDYIDFVGIPSTNDEEVQLKQSVADIIMRMFSEISKGDYPSLLINSVEQSATKRPLKSDMESFLSEESKEDCAMDIPETLSKHDVMGLSERRIYKQSTAKCVPYHPSSASRTYYIVSSEDKDKNLGDKNITANSQNVTPKSGLRNSSEKDEQGILDNGPVTTSDSLLHQDLDINHSGSHKHIDIADDQNASCKGIYQDRHGMLHVAHQPPGYNCNFDSHLSESLSDNDANILRNREEEKYFNTDGMLGTLPNTDRGRNMPVVFSSTGSESAYETIRERHQNIGEALASSFEFYSTSPRDARVLGYVTSDPEKQKLVVIQDGSRINEASLCPHISDVAGITISSNKSTEREIFSSTDSYQNRQYVPRTSPKKSLRKTRPIRKSKPRSNITESDEASSNVSLVQIQRQRYVRRFKNYIHTLRKLERNLMPPSLESSLESKRLTVETNELSSEENRTDFQNVAANSNGNIDASLPISSEDSSLINNKSIDGVDNSLIIHRTCSAAMINHSNSSSIAKSIMTATGSSINSNLPSSGSSTEHTLSLCREKKKKTRPKSANNDCNFDSMLVNCGKISDFRKLMSSSSAPGEVRPYRYLLQKNNLRDKINKINENTSTPEDTEQVGNNKELMNSSETMEKKATFESNYPSKSCDTSFSVFEEGLFSEKGKAAMSEPKIHEFHKLHVWMNNSTSSGSRLKVSSKETQDFCQMYPSLSSLQIDEEKIELPKLSLAVGTQTDESEVSFDIVDKPIVHLNEVVTNDHNRAYRENCLKSDELSVVNLDQCPISLLDQMEAKIKDNTEKINSALEDYNKQFGPLTFETIPNKNSEAKFQSIAKPNITKLNFHKEISDLSNQNVQSFKNAEKKDYGHRIYTKIDKPLKSFDTAKNRMKFVLNDEPSGNKESLNKSLAEELIQLNKEKEIMTLQEALALARPNYIKDAEKRRIKICRKQTLRRELQEHNQSVLAQLPDNLKTPTVLRKFLYQPDESPLFNYKTMREQNKRLYQMLPEAQKPTIVHKKESKAKVQRLMASYYSQKLRGKVLSGKVSHAHCNIVTPIR